MKKLLFLLFLSSAAFAQNQYISTEGDTLEVGKTIILGLPTGNTGFRYITQGNEPVANWLAGEKVKIHKFKTVRSKMYVLFKGYGLIPVYIDWEIARRAGEVERL